MNEDIRDFDRAIKVVETVARSVQDAVGMPSVPSKLDMHAWGILFGLQTAAGIMRKMRTDTKESDKAKAATP